MTQPRDKSLDELHQQVTATRARLVQADEHLRELGEGAQKVGLSVDGAMLEINALLKQLFLCSQHNLPEYDMLHAELVRHLNNIFYIAKTQFGKLKQDDVAKGAH